MEDRLVALENEVASLRAALELTDELPRRKPGRPKKHEEVERA
jgi:Flp pilus assembly CpaE family ATPase